MSLEETLAIIQHDAGSHFDPVLVALFMDIAPGLYAEIGQAGESQLQTRMREQAMHYFLQASLVANENAKRGG